MSLYRAQANNDCKYYRAIVEFFRLFLYKILVLAVSKGSAVAA